MSTSKWKIVKLMLKILNLFDCASVDVQQASGMVRKEGKKPSVDEFLDQFKRRFNNVREEYDAFFDQQSWGAQ